MANKKSGEMPFTQQRRYAVPGDLGATTAIPYYQPRLEVGECRRFPKEEYTGEMNLSVPSTMTYTAEGKKD